MIRAVLGHGYLMRDGKTAWVIARHRPGNGHSVSWDTVAPHADRYRPGEYAEWCARANAGQAGVMGERAFERQIVSEV